MTKEELMQLRKYQWDIDRKINELQVIIGESNLHIRDVINDVIRKEKREENND